MGPTPPTPTNIAKKVSGNALIAIWEASDNGAMNQSYDMQPDQIKDGDGGRITHPTATLQYNTPGLTGPLIFTKSSGNGLITGMATEDAESALSFQFAVDPALELARHHVRGDIVGNTIGDQKHRGQVM